MSGSGPGGGTAPVDVDGFSVDAGAPNVFDGPSLGTRPIGGGGSSFTETLRNILNAPADDPATILSEVERGTVADAPARAEAAERTRQHVAKIAEEFQDMKRGGDLFLSRFNKHVDVLAGQLLDLHYPTTSLSYLGFQRQRPGESLAAKRARERQAREVAEAAAEGGSGDTMDDGDAEWNQERRMRPAERQARTERRGGRRGEAAGGDGGDGGEGGDGRGGEPADVGMGEGGGDNDDGDDSVSLISGLPSAYVEAWDTPSGAVDRYCKASMGMYASCCCSCKVAGSVFTDVVHVV